MKAQCPDKESFLTDPIGGLLSPSDVTRPLFLSASGGRTLSPPKGAAFDGLAAFSWYSDSERRRAQCLKVAS